MINEPAAKQPLLSYDELASHIGRRYARWLVNRYRKGENLRKYRISPKAQQLIATEAEKTHTPRKG